MIRPPPVAALRPEVDDPVGRLDDVEVVLDDEDRVAAVDQPVEDLEQLLDVGEVEPGRRLVEDVERPAGRPPRQLGRQLDPLRLAARQGRRRLAEVDVAQADVVQRLELGPDVRHRREEVERLGDGHLEDVGDRLALVVDLERLAVVALAVADLARDVDVGQELHLDLEDAVALAVLAAAALDVEAEAARGVAAQTRLRDAGEQLADRREQADVGRRVRARRPADRALVDLDDLVDVLGALERVVRADRLARAVQLAGERPVEDLGDERALAAARHAGDGDERPERDTQVEVAQVVLAGAADPELLAVALPALGRDRDRRLAAQERAGDRARLGEDHLERPVGDDLAAVLARPGPDVDDPVGGPDRLLVVLDDEDRVAQVAQPRQRRDELRVVALVEPDRRLVEDVQHAHQRRPDLGREPDPLRLAARQRDARPIEGQVVEPDVDEEARAARRSP